MTPQNILANAKISGNNLSGNVIAEAGSHTLFTLFLREKWSGGCR